MSGKNGKLTPEKQWSEFKKKYGKTYASKEEEAKRFKIFQDNLKLINENDQKYKRGESSFTVGITFLTDMTNEEIKPHYTEDNKLIIPCHPPGTAPDPLLASYPAVWQPLGSTSGSAGGPIIISSYSAGLVPAAGCIQSPIIIPPTYPEGFGPEGSAAGPAGK